MADVMWIRWGSVVTHNCSYIGDIQVINHENDDKIASIDLYAGDPRIVMRPIEALMHKRITVFIVPDLDEAKQGIISDAISLLQPYTMSIWSTGKHFPRWMDQFSPTIRSITTNAAREDISALYEIISNYDILADIHIRVKCDNDNLSRCTISAPYPSRHRCVHPIADPILPLHANRKWSPRRARAFSRDQNACIAIFTAVVFRMIDETTVAPVDPAAFEYVPRALKWYPGE
jgi:hypothetical protein